MAEAFGGYAVEFKLDCPHILKSLKADVHIDLNTECGACKNKGENWVCLSCSAVCCSRYVKEHMVVHYQETDHPIALSFSDASVWCYKCDYYIDSPSLKAIRKSVELAKKV